MISSEQKGGKVKQSKTCLLGAYFAPTLGKLISKVSKLVKQAGEATARFGFRSLHSRGSI